MSPATLHAVVLLSSAFGLAGLIWLLVWYDRTFPEGMVRVRNQKVLSEQEALKALLESVE